MKTTRPSACLGQLLFAGLVCVLMTGCSGGSKNAVPVYRTSGSVHFNGEALAGAAVVFHPDPSSPLAGNSLVPVPGAHTRANGTFEVSTFRPGDGLPKGDFLVTVSCENREAKPVNGEFPELLPSHYQDPVTSGLKVTIVAGKNVLPAFELK